MKLVTTHLRRITCVTLACGTVLVGYQALNWGIADHHSFDARSIVKSWDEDDQFQVSELYRAISLTRQSLEKAPTHPGYLDKLAGYLLTQYQIDRDDTLVQESRNLLIASRRVRPEWPANWAKYIEMKHMIREVDEDLDHAIRIATTVGPWESSVIESVTLAGVSSFASFSVITQDAIVQNILNGLRSPIPGLGDRTYELVIQRANGWSFAFIQSMIDSLIQIEWTTESQINSAKLALQWWKLASRTQQNSLAGKIGKAASSTKGVDLYQHLERHHLSQLCVYLPRSQPFAAECQS